MPNQLSQRGSQINSQRGVAPQLSSRRGVQQRSARQIDSKRSNSASQAEEGGVIGGEYLVNPVFLSAAQMTSAFDKDLENDFEGADQTL